MKTLADMTEEERADCVGMWCDITNANKNTERPVVLCGSVRINTDECDELMPIYIPWVTAELYPETEGVSGWSAEHLRPRFDLPRAWMPDGQPPLDQYWTIEQASDYTQLSDRTLRRFIAEGHLTAYRAGRAIRLKPEDVDAIFTRVKPRQEEA